MNAAEVKAALAVKWPDSRHLHVYEAPLDHGRQGCKIDVLVMGLWQSDGHHLDAVEIKVSYSDWCKEWRRTEWDIVKHDGQRLACRTKPTDWALQQHSSRMSSYTKVHLRTSGLEAQIPPDDFEPAVERRHVIDTSKNAAWRLHAHRFWIAAPLGLAEKIARDIQATPEMAGWGVISVQPYAAGVMVKPHTRTPRPLTYRQHLGITRAAADSGANALMRAEMSGRNEGHKEARRTLRHEEDRLRQRLWVAATQPERTP